MKAKEGQGRIEFLREIVNEGTEAESVLRYIVKYREKADIEILEALTKDNINKEELASAISDYRAVARFCDMLNQAMSLGKRKEKSLETELKKPR